MIERLSTTNQNIITANNIAKYNHAKSLITPCALKTIRIKKNLTGGKKKTKAPCSYHLFIVTNITFLYT